MAGLAAAARLRQLGVDARLVEKGDRAGGSMLLSSGYVWRYRSFDVFREQCPRGNQRLQRLVHERLDAALDWLEELGAPVLARDTGNPLTTGRRFDTAALTDTLAAAAGGVELETPLAAEGRPIVLATGGFQGDRQLVERYVAPAGRLPVRANPWSAGDGLRLATARGAALAPPLDEFFGRALPAVDTIAPEDFVRAAQLYGRHAHVVDLDGEPLGVTPAWAELDLVQAIARRRGGRAWYVVDGEALAQPVRERTVADMVAVAEEVGAPVVRVPRLDALADAFGFPVAAERLARPPFAAVQVEAWITHTIGGLAVDERARVLDAAGRPLPDLYAAGVDAGGISGGGYASGLAQALVLGLVAAESVATQAG
jgi:succinate dehydrogenase/fumarate reductase flavoprotein subunit